ncbi:MAG: pyridoxamine 5'-phosphate oxidase family protein, partial [Aggregatilineales bacterium]
RSSFEMPEHSLTAEQVCTLFTGIKNIALASVTRKNAPRVAPIGALFYRGRFYIPTMAHAARTRMLQRNPAVSLTYYEDVDLALILHGEATVIDAGHIYFETLLALHSEVNNGSNITAWGDNGVYLRINADVIYTFNRHLDRDFTENN